MTPQQPPFQCDFPGCSLSYRRKEHLTRHAKSHIQPRSYECPFCDRVYARNDTRRQHIRTHHKNKECQSSRAVRACQYCRLRRSKCNGQSPCDACSQRGKQCLYSQNSRRLTENNSCRTAPYVEAYFEIFHRHWPLLHPATFDPGREPAFLLQSVIMMGLWVTGESNARQTAKVLHQKLSLLIYEQKEIWDTSNHHDESQRQPNDTSSPEPTPWPMATYQGILLHLIFSLLISQDQLDLQLTHALPELPSRLLVALVRSCLKRNMFFYPSMLTQFKPGVDPDVFIWLGIEEIKRFCLSLYRVCRQCRVFDPKILEDAPTFSARRGPRAPGERLLSLTDLQFALPDSDELWDATSGLAARLAENPAACHNANVEEKWISQTARLLQPRDAQVQWI
ncbi:Fungal Zn(2)-Cys(6) and C2H2 domain-containing protein [Penicillium ucsense]|uniref:Fungal Zn(2)-Cys(6) and C2H2 domain-containing protein n=1 Tax=Penicillium ucsense TaxID=2839758 RepID=A0A8J8VYF8_9EURO|nr:Fungal Zn(2)-Cys(6) and C2H2 domain-containing protein [Penicillium ucsense]KAF7733736.1 Fungal Zn(2)-Cys(6) and C2H2 domain-containing protein [Penicillium ucsense]